MGASPAPRRKRQSTALVVGLVAGFLGLLGLGHLYLGYTRRGLVLLVSSLVVMGSFWTTVALALSAYLPIYPDLLKGRLPERGEVGGLVAALVLILVLGTGHLLLLAWQSADVLRRREQTFRQTAEGSDRQPPGVTN